MFRLLPPLIKVEQFTISEWEHDFRRDLVVSQIGMSPVRRFYLGVLAGRLFFALEDSSAYISVAELRCGGGKNVIKRDSAAG